MRLWIDLHALLNTHTHTHTKNDDIYCIYVESLGKNRRRIDRIDDGDG